jgi:large subunit ribosomal protein L4
MPRQMRRAALRSALSVKAADSQIIVLEDLNIDGTKTKAMAQILAGLVGAGQTTLVLLAAKNEPVENALRNLTNAKYLRANYLNIRDLLGYDMVLLPLGALEVIEGYLG